MKNVVSRLSFFLVLFGAWGIICIPGRTALGLTGDNPAEGVKTIRVTTANIRTQPSMTAAIVTRLKQGTAVDTISRQGDWFAVKLPDGRLGWAHQKLFAGPTAYSVAGGETGRLVTAIQTEILSADREKVIFQLNGTYPPKTFVVDAERPRVVCDFPGLLLGSHIGRVIKVNGRLVEQVRLAYHAKTPAKVRAVIDLVPDRKYEIDQTFFRQASIFELTVRPGQ